MLTKDYVKEKVTSLLPIDSDLWVDQADILVSGAMRKLKSEGVDFNFIEPNTMDADDYCICVSYQVAIDIDANADHVRLTHMYITRVNTLRTSLINV